MRMTITSERGVMRTKTLSRLHAKTLDMDKLNDFVTFIIRDSFGKIVKEAEIVRLFHGKWCEEMKSKISRLDQRYLILHKSFWVGGTLVVDVEIE